MTTSDEIRSEILRFLEGETEPWAWDDFISRPLGNSYFNAIRVICRDLPEQFPPEQGTQFYCNKEGVMALGIIAARLLP